MAAADLSEFESEWVEPISTDYRGWKVYELPPNGQGMATLEMLNIMERFPLASYGPLSADAFHIKMEAQKLAYADLQRYLADPRYAQSAGGGDRFEEVCGASARRLIDSDAGALRRGAGRSETICGRHDLSVGGGSRGQHRVADSERLSCASARAWWWTDYGFRLQNRGGLFEMDAAHPNALAPRKRPFHTIIPAFMEKGPVHIGFGIMGGLNQAQAHAQFVSNLVDHEMNIQAALEAPRFTKLNFGGCDVMIEARVPADVRAELDLEGPQARPAGRFFELDGRRAGGGARFGDGSELRGVVARARTARRCRKRRTTPASRPKAKSKIQKAKVDPTVFHRGGGDGAAQRPG